MKYLINKGNKHLINKRVYNYHPKTNGQLKDIVDKLIEERGLEADLNDIDTSLITDMKFIFRDSPFNGDISEWDVSKVENMEGMFNCSKFNGDISDWDISNVKDMRNMFRASAFNQNIDNWKPDIRVKISEMFSNCPIQKQFNYPKWYYEIIRIDNKYR